VIKVAFLHTLLLFTFKLETYRYYRPIFDLLNIDRYTNFYRYLTF